MPMKRIYNQKGQSFVEYTFLLSFIAMGVVIALTVLGAGVRDFFAALNSIAF